MSGSKPVVWVLSDGKPGHVSQSKGVVAALSSRREIQVEWVDCQLAFSFLRFLMRKIANGLDLQSMSEKLTWFYRRLTLPQSKPDLIISSGGNTLFALAALGHRYQAKTIYSGTLKKYSAELYDRVITVSSINTDNNLVLPLPPVDLSFPERSATGGFQEAREQGNAIGAVLIGGDGAGYQYQKEDWQRLIALLEENSQRQIQWLLTTSRRTGQETESFLQQKVDQAGLSFLKAVWWGERPEKVMAQFLSECDFVLCTEDSLSMVAEAIYSGKPVFTFKPASGGELTENDEMALSNYQSNGLIIRLEKEDRLLEIEEMSAELPDVSGIIFEDVRQLLNLP